MLVLLLRKMSSRTLEDLYEEAPRLRKLVKVLSYEDLESRKELRCAALVFADHERMLPFELAAARDLATRVRETAPSVRLLNDPHRTLRRFDLLQRLRDAGVNEFRAFRLSDVPRDVRFPVFLRLEDDHKGPRTDLLPTRRQLNRHIQRLTHIGRDLNQILAVEFVDVSDAKGLYHKYAAWIVDDEVIPRHLVFSRGWNLNVPDVHQKRRQAVEEAYFEENPHRDELLELARLTGAEYGKFDYALKDGRIQIWEFNTNPKVTRLAVYNPKRLHLERRFRAALADALERLSTAARNVRVPLGVAPGSFAR